MPHRTSSLKNLALIGAPLVAVFAVDLGATPARTEAQASVVAARHTLSLAGAQRVLDAGLAAARERRAGGAIAVVDEGGHLIALARLDDTFPAAALVSTDKARTAATFRKPTSVFEDSIKGGRVALTAVAHMTPLQGGIPIVHDGLVVGAVGVSGAHSALEDEEIAKAAAQALTGTP